jgi:hypothetical protein
MTSCRLRARACAAALAVLASASAGPAAAQPAQEADELFRRGHALYDEGKLEEACRTLARSQALDPSVGTLGLLAACEEKRGLLARAYADFRETERLAGKAKDARGAYAAERAAALLARVGRLVIQVDPTAPPARVTRAGEEVRAADLGAELVVDPGSFEIVAAGPDGSEIRRSVTIAAGQRLEVVLPALARKPLAPVEHPVMRALAYVTGAVGLAGVGVGAGLGALAISRNTASMSCMPSARTCPARDDAFTAANASTAAFVVGLAAVGTGVVLFVVSRPSAPAVPGSAVSIGLSPSVGARGGGLSVGGAF